MTRACMRECSPTCTFSSAVIVRNSLMFWNVRATPACGDEVRRAWR